MTLPRSQEQEVPEHIYVPATYVEKFEDRNISVDVSILHGISFDQSRHNFISYIFRNKNNAWKSISS